MAGWLGGWNVKELAGCFGKTKIRINCSLTGCQRPGSNQTGQECVKTVNIETDSILISEG